MIRPVLLFAAWGLVVPAAFGEESRVAAEGNVEWAFEPWDDAEAAVIRVIDAARDQLLLQSYVFTSKRIARALLRAAARGVRVEVLADAAMHRRPGGNVLPMLVDGGIPVALETRYAAAHNKVLIADPDGAHPATVTGSYNFTWSAARRNAENIVILRDHPALARAFAANWRRHRAEAEPVDRALRPRRR